MLMRALRIGRQLQDGCVLAEAKPGYQNDSAIRKFERVVMGVRSVHVDLPEPGDPLSRVAKTEARKHVTENMLDLDIRIEGEFGARP